jgi:hypothetical protein
VCSHQALLQQRHLWRQTCARLPKMHVIEILINIISLICHSIVDLLLYGLGLCVWIVQGTLGLIQSVTGKLLWGLLSLFVPDWILEPLSSNMNSVFGWMAIIIVISGIFFSVSVTALQRTLNSRDSSSRSSGIGSSERVSPKIPAPSSSSSSSRGAATRRPAAPATIKDDNDGKCVICLVGGACVAIIPCGHACLCAECGARDKLRRLRNRCPTCRGPIQSAIRVYR